MARPDFLGRYVLQSLIGEPDGVNKRTLTAPENVQTFRDAQIRQRVWGRASVKPDDIHERGIEAALTRLFRQGKIVRQAYYRTKEVIDKNGKPMVSIYQEYRYFLPDIEPNPPAEGETVGPIERYEE